MSPWMSTFVALFLSVVSLCTGIHGYEDNLHGRALPDLTISEDRPGMCSPLTATGSDGIDTLAAASPVFFDVHGGLEACGTCLEVELLSAAGGHLPVKTFRALVVDLCHECADGDLRVDANLGLNDTAEIRWHAIPCPSAASVSPLADADATDKNASDIATVRELGLAHTGTTLKFTFTADSTAYWLALQVSNSPVGIVKMSIWHKDSKAFVDTYKELGAFTVNVSSLASVSWPNNKWRPGYLLKLTDNTGAEAYGVLPLRGLSSIQTITSDMAFEKVPHCAEYDYSYKGDTMATSTNVGSAPACQALCSASSGCKFFTYLKARGDCVLMRTMTGRTNDTSAISGPKRCLYDCYEPYTKYEGPFIREIKGIHSAAECQQECAMDSECRRFSYLLGPLQCLLYKSDIVRTFPFYHTEHNAVSGPGQCSEACWKGNFDYPGNDLQPKPLEVSSAEMCHLACHRTAMCKFYSFQTKTNECYLKSWMPGERKWSPGATISGDLLCGQAAGCFHERTEYKGSDIYAVPQSVSPQQCQRHCQAEPECYFWSWQAFTWPPANCLLKGAAAAGGKTAVPGPVVSGPKYCAEDMSPLSESEGHFLCDKVNGYWNDNGPVCCPKECTRCGGAECHKLPLGPQNCCANAIKKTDRQCGLHTAPCNLTPSLLLTYPVTSHASFCTRQLGGTYDAANDACCPAYCGTCGGVGCENRPGGRPNCCGDKIVTDFTKTCEDTMRPPCHFDRRVYAPTSSVDFRLRGFAAPSVQGEAGSLRALADKKKLYIGAAASNWFVGGQTYRDVLAREFNSLVAENECKMSWIRPTATKFNFASCDKMADLAKTNGQMMRFHAAVWYSGVPGWIFKTKKEELRDIIIKQVEGVMEHYIDMPHMLHFDVANEAVDDDQPTADPVSNPKWRQSWLSKVPDWVEISFRTAAMVQKARPGNKARMYYNDYSILTATPHSRRGRKSAAVYGMILGLLQRSFTVHGVGFQTHITTAFADFDGVRENIRRYAAIGVEVCFTEVDVPCGSWEDGKWAPCATFTPELQYIQAMVYGSLLKICLEEPNCVGFVLWGFTDRATWLRGDHPLLFTRDYKPKRAYHEVASILAS
ncbi:unnamed protein product [Vitrella brassicaformis CCMP3155]|uniref:endo-1,4-beta-xylanase n=1 Tax=Vitrella brassicaformis (strain CCMP3155) TaxID=1169540 RepID=A0A0G4G5L3_VITBC|nr:unnamed protein product [Vitrella brassicaformis CCMP3155]|eukprot:CEM23853.1 unnamed protein product [Vitrella brassicaformis CCMP3155]